MKILWCFGRLSCRARPSTVGVEPWSTSGGQVPFVMQTFFRVAFVVQGLVCVGLVVSYKLFALYAALALAGLAVVAHTDPPEW